MNALRNPARGVYHNGIMYFVLCLLPVLPGTICPAICLSAAILTGTTAGQNTPLRRSAATSDIAATTARTQPDLCLRGRPGDRVPGADLAQAIVLRRAENVSAPKPRADFQYAVRQPCPDNTHQNTKYACQPPPQLERRWIARFPMRSCPPALYGLEMKRTSS